MTCKKKIFLTIFWFPFLAIASETAQKKFVAAMNDLSRQKFISSASINEVESIGVRQPGELGGVTLPIEIDNTSDEDGSLQSVVRSLIYFRKYDWQTVQARALQALISNARNNEQGFAPNIQSLLQERNLIDTAGNIPPLVAAYVKMHSIIRKKQYDLLISPTHLTDDKRLLDNLAVVLWDGSVSPLNPDLLERFPEVIHFYKKYPQFNEEGKTIDCRAAKISLHEQLANGIVKKTKINIQAIRKQNIDIFNEHIYAFWAPSHKKDAFAAVLSPFLLEPRDLEDEDDIDY
jgi:hypothetical protein